MLRNLIRKVFSLPIATNFSLGPLPMLLFTRLTEILQAAVIFCQAGIFKPEDLGWE